MKKVIVFGNGRWAELMYCYLTQDSSFELAGFTVDPQYVKEDKLFGLPVVPFDKVEMVFPPTEYSMLVALSYQKINRLREEKYYQAKAKGYELITFIHPKTTTWPGLIIGDNCLVSENSSLNPFVKIGNNVTWSLRPDRSSFGYRGPLLYLFRYSDSGQCHRRTVLPPGAKLNDQGKSHDRR
jgi:hypothetical protein